MLDFSRLPELGLHATVVADVQAAAAPLGIHPLIVGAFARDLHLVHAHGLAIQRQTEDIDLALAVPDWQAFDELKARLVASGKFGASGTAHRFRHGSVPVDLVPFGPVESADRRIAWPPDGDPILDVFGFREAQRTAVHVVLTGGVRTSVVSLPALALLKLVCWNDRHLTTPGKDASDLQLIVANYLPAGNQDRLWSEFVHWTQADDFEYEPAGARMLGRDIAALLDDRGHARIAALLATQADATHPAPLPFQMNNAAPERARALIAAMLEGLTEIRA